MNEKKKILIVEDDPDIRSVLSMVIEADGYSVVTANNGLEALETIQKDGLPQLILLDMKMPIMDGWQFAEAFYKLHGHAVPLVVMTAAADAAKRASDISANGWLEKPFDLSNLQTALQKYLN